MAIPRRRIRSAVLAAAIIMLLSTGAAAFDGHRSGFILGFGLGPGLTVEGGDNNLHLFNTDFRIGGGSQQMQYYWSAKVSWVPFETYSESVTETFGLGGFGISYYFQPAAPSWYTTASIGVASISFPLEDNAPDPDFGFGLSAGMGYEFSPHFSVEGNLVCGSINYYRDYYRAIWSFKVTFNVLAY